MGARQAEGLQPRSRRAPQESDPGRVPRIMSFSGWLFLSGALFPLLFFAFHCPISDFGSRRRPISRKREKTQKNILLPQYKEKKTRKKPVGALVQLLWRAAAVGLKPLHLPRARNEASSCPATLLFYYVASSPVHPSPIFLTDTENL